MRNLAEHRTAEHSKSPPPLEGGDAQHRGMKGLATLGALIGAGGYGQPILTGIRLDNISLIMEGAVPAALLMQGVFELIERALTPRGLRLRAQA